MRQYRKATKWSANRPKRLRPRRRKPPMIVIFLAVFVATIAIAQVYVSGRFTGITDRVNAWAYSATIPGSEGEVEQISAAPVRSPSDRNDEEIEQKPAAAHIQFSYCHEGGGTNCVVDGDTIWLDGVKVRIADIDTPETHDYQCPAEKELGDRATTRLQEVLNGGPISLAPVDRDEDQYGRKLRIVMVNGESVGETLVGEGLARWYGSGRQPWC